MKHRVGRNRRSILYVALASGALGGATPAMAQQTDTVRVRTTTTLDAQVERIARAISSQRRIQEEAVISLGRLRRQGAQADDREVQTYQEQLRVAVQAQQVLRQRLETLCSSDQRPQGWLGVTLQGQLTVAREGNGPNVFMYGQHPRVESVEPGSPAAKAGVQSGDVIVALGGRDIRTDEVIPTELLRPGARLPVRVLRSNGVNKMIIVRIEPRPDGFAETPCPWIDANIAAAMAPPRPAQAYGFVFTDSTPATTRAIRVRPMPTPRAPQGPSVVATPMPAPTPVPGFEGGAYAGPLIPFTSGGGTVAGARLMPMNPDLGANFGVDEGLLVLQVAPGTPAQGAGLKSGDVLISANDQPLRSTIALQREISLSSERLVKLVFIRRHEKQTATLRW